MNENKEPTGKRRLPLDPATRQLVFAATTRLGFPPSRYLFGPNATWAIRIALSYAKRAGITPVEDGIANGTVALKIDTAGMYDDLDAGKVAQVVRQAFHHYTEKGMPSDRALESRPGMWITLPQSLLSEIAVNAFASRRASEVEAVDTLEEAMRRSLRELPVSDEGEVPRDVHLRLDVALSEKFRARASLTDHDADTLLWGAAREVAKERREVKT